MQFRVPQFLDIEDKVFGPFTFSQFIYLAGGAGLCYVLFKALGFLWASIPIIAIASFSVALAFFKPNGKPFIQMLQAGIKFAFQDKLYIWKRREIKKSSIQKTKEIEPEALSEAEEIANMRHGHVTKSRLRDLAWSLDILDLKKDNNES